MRPSSDTLLVWTGAQCVAGCATCPIDPGIAPPGLGVAELQHLMAGPASAGRLTVLVGGEPFLRSDILRLLAAIRAAGGVPGIVSTGRPLVYPQLRDRLRRMGLAYLRIQLFGVGAAHDRATAVPGGFEQVLDGLRAWVAECGAECDVDVALTIRQRSADRLVCEVEELARQIPPTVQIVIGIDPPPVDATDREAMRAAVAGLAGWNDDPTRPLLSWEGLSEAPARTCLGIRPLGPVFAGAAPRACCLGVVDGRRGISLDGIEQTKANSFNFVRRDTTVPWSADSAACTAHRAAADIDPFRQLWLIENGRLVLHTTDTGDFSPAEIARVKDELSHLFIDRAAAGVLDDFTEGMRRVLPDPTCATCACRAGCGRRFQLVEGPPFAREEAWIADFITSLRGRVLDVGCGEQLYRDQLGPLLRSGAVQYTGLDPDQISLDRIRAALPGGRFHLCGIEDFRGEPASYDHVLCLRSLNHVFDLDEALARMSALLRPGGSLLIVEMTPFAMLRRAEQVAAADRAPRAGHQHLRNVASEEVLPFARRRGLSVRHHHPASLPTTNQWILLLERLG